MANVLVDAAGSEIPGFFIGGRPESLVILHDIFGATNQMRGVAKRFANEGFSVFLPDLFGRTTDDEAKGAAMVQSTSWKTAIASIRSATAALGHRGQGAGVAVVGFGFGGAMALAASAHIEGLAGCVTFYGIPTVDRGDLTRIKAKVQGHFGNQDKKFTRDRVDALELKLKDASIAVEFHRYHTGHFFFNEMRKLTHSPHNSELAFHRTVPFLKRALGIAL